MDKKAGARHYNHYKIPKSGGRKRTISSPAPALKAAQRWVHDHVLKNVPAHRSAHAFTAGKSTVTNAALHLNARIVISIDLLDFFPSIRYGRVLELFLSLGYTRLVSAVLARICTEPGRKKKKRKGNRHPVHDRVLPQGAPSSPAISNLICRQMDERLTAFCKRKGARYSRYVDDLVFSFDGESLTEAVIRKVYRVVREEGFRANRKKTRVMQGKKGQEMHGLTLDGGINVTRAWERKLKKDLKRAYQRARRGERLKKPIERLQGKVAYYQMVAPERARHYREKLERIRELANSG